MKIRIMTYFYLYNIIKIKNACMYTEIYKSCKKIRIANKKYIDN